MSIRSASVGPQRRGGHAIPRLREKILTSALELFAHNGFDKVTARPATIKPKRNFYAAASCDRGLSTL
jgi:hypothetical protein